MYCEMIGVLQDTCASCIFFLENELYGSNKQWFYKGQLKPKGLYM